MEQQRLVTDLLTPLWAGIAGDYKKQYSYGIWQQFEDNIRSAAYTNRLSEFLSKITARLGITMMSEHLDRVQAVINSGEDKAVLKSLRDETALLVLMARLENEERKEKLKAKKEKNADISISGHADGALFDQP